MPKRRRKRAKPLRFKIFIVATIIALVPTVGISWALIHSAVQAEKEAVLSQIQSQSLILAGKLSSSDYFDTYKEDNKRSVVDQYADIWGGRVQIMNESGEIILDTYDIDGGRYNTSDAVLASLSGQTSAHINDNMTAIVSQPIFSEDETELVVPLDKLEKGEEATYRQKVLGVVLVTLDVTQRVSPLTQVSYQMYFLWIAAAAIIIFVMWITCVHFFKPLKKLVRDIDDAADGNIAAVDVHSSREVSEISDAVNYSLERIRTIDASRREFISNVSHELKTPITSMRVIADSINSMDVVPAEMYEEFMRDISNELTREGQIIDDLLQISKLEEGAISISPEETNLNEWLEKILLGLKNFADEHGVEIIYESFRPVNAEIDATKLMLSVKNLVENAIKYNEEQGSVKVSLNADHHFFFIKVEDNGIGIPEEDLPNVFDRFFRVDKDRSRESGGTGLGLAIAKQIVILHHGAIKVSSVLGEGTTFVIRVPIRFKEVEEELNA